MQLFALNVLPKYSLSNNILPNDRIHALLNSLTRRELPSSYKDPLMSAWYVELGAIHGVVRGGCHVISKSQAGAS
jgi:hypothetical protein